MIVNDIMPMVIKLHALKVTGGRRYKEVLRLLSLEATTHNLQQVQQYLKDKK